MRIIFINRNNPTDFQFIRYHSCFKWTIEQNIQRDTKEGFKKYNYFSRNTYGPLALFVFKLPIICSIFPGVVGLR
jgi:hypothetical protein